MESQNQPVEQNKVKLTVQTLQSATSVRALLEIDAVKENWVRTYEKISGKPDGSLRFEAEKILFMQKVTENQALEKADKFTVYGSFIELAVSGLTLRDGLTYIIPQKGKATFQVGWKGRLEQINQIPNVIHVSEPICIYNTDEYELLAGEKVTIKHTPRIGHPEEDRGEVVLVYLVVQFRHGKEVYYMTRDEVLHIRDTYSNAYKDYIKKEREKKLESWMEPPMWITNEAQAFKKTLVKRVYNNLPKLPSHKYLDERLEQYLKEQLDIKDPDEYEHPESLSEEETNSVIHQAMNLPEERRIPGKDILPNPSAMPEQFKKRTTKPRDKKKEAGENTSTPPDFMQPEKKQEEPSNEAPLELDLGEGL